MNFSPGRASHSRPCLPHQEQVRLAISPGHPVFSDRNRQLGRGIAGGTLEDTKRGVLILSASLVLALCLGPIGLIGNVWMIAGLLLVMGAAAGLCNVNISAWIMQRIDPGVRGRVSSVLMLAAVGLTRRLWHWLVSSSLGICN